MKKELLHSKILTTALLLLTLFFANGSFAQKTWDRGAGNNNWNSANNWNPNGVPAATDDVIIPNNFTVDVNTTAVCKSLTINGGGNTNNVNITSPNSLTVSGAVSIGAGTGNGDNKFLNVGSGTLSCTAITVTAPGNTNRASGITLSTGTITVTGNITLGSTDADFTFTGGGTLNVGGNMSGGTFNRSSGTVNYYGDGTGGTSSNQTIGAYTYNNLTTSGNGVKSLTANTFVNGGNLNIGSGTTLDLLTYTCNRSAAGGTLTVAGTLALGATTGGQTGSNFPTNFSTLTMTGGTVDYNVLAGGQTVYNTPNYNNLTLSNTSGTQTTGGNITVNGTLTTTAGGALNMGTNQLLGSLTSVANSGTIRTQNTTATPIPSGKTWGGTVQYDGAGQTVVSGTYNNLNFAGTGTKTLSSALAIGGNLSIGSGVIANLSTFSSTANTLSINGNNQPSGVFGGTTSGAAYTIPTYFATATGILTVGTSSCTAGTWIGNTSTDWNTASNWCDGSVPIASTNVIIPSGTPFAPAIGATGATCTNLTINSGATLTVSAASTLVINGTFTKTGTLTTAGSSTVNYAQASGTQVVVANSYGLVTLSGGGTKTLSTGISITNTLSLTGTVTATTVEAMALGGNLNIGAGTTFATGANNAWTLSVSGSTTVDGTLTLANTAAKTFTGNVTVNSGGIWNETGAAAINHALNLQNDGTYTANTGVHTFSGTTRTISGANAVVIPNLTITGTITNINTLTVSTTIAGAGTLTNGDGTTGILNYAGTSIVPTLVASATNNTVNYNNLAGGQNISGVSYNTLTLSNTSGTQTAANNIVAATLNNANANSTLNMATFTLGVTTVSNSGTIRTQNTSATPITSGKTWGGKVQYDGAGQTVVAGTYNNLDFAGTGTKTLSGILTVGADLNIASGVVANLGAFTSSANKLILGGFTQPIGSYGGTTSPATYINTTYFANATGIINVAACGSGVWTGATDTVWGTTTNWCDGVVPTASTNVTINSGGNQPVISAAAVCNSITLGSGSSLTINNTLVVSGSWTNNGSTITGTSNVTFNGAGTIGGSTATTFPNNLTITGTVTQDNTVNVTGNFSQTAGTYNVSSSASSNTLAITGNFSQSGGTFNVSNGANSSILTVGGTYTLSGGVFVLENTTTATGGTVTVTGLTTISGTGIIMMDRAGSTATCNFNAVNFTASGTGGNTDDTNRNNCSIDFGLGTVVNHCRFNISGNFVHSSTNVFYTSATAQVGSFIFNGGGTQTFSYSGTNSQYTSYTVNVGATLQLLTGLTLGNSTALPASTFTVNGTLEVPNTFFIAGSNNAQEAFVLSAGATLITGSAFGVVTTTNGTIRTNLGTRTFNSAANYVFNGTVNQNTALPNLTVNNLTIANTGVTNKTVSLTAAPIVNGTLAVNNGILDAASFQIVGNATNNFTIASGARFRMAGAAAANFPTLFTSANCIFNVNSTVEYYGATQTINSTPTYGNLTITNAGNKTAGGSLNVAGNLTINTTSTTIFLGSTFTHNVAGNWINDGTFTANTSTINFNGAGAQTIGGAATTTFNNLTVNTNTNANTVTSITKAFAASGNVLVTKGNLILQATDADYLVTGNLTVPANGTLTHSVDWDVSSKLLRVTGNIVVDGIFTYTVRSHVQMNGVNKTIQSGSNASSAFSVVTLANPSGTINASGILKINDNFWCGFGTTGGTFATNGQTVTANAGLLNSGGTVNINGGTLNITAGLSVGISTNNGTVNFSSGTLNTDALTIGDGTRTGIFNQTGGTANVSNNLIINPSCSLTFTNSPAFNIAGNWINNGTYTKATETITFNGTSAISGASTNTFNNITISGTLTGPSAANINVAGNWTNNGTYAHNSGTVTFNGTTQTIGGSANSNFNNLTLSTSSSTKTFGIGNTVAANMVIDSGVIADLGTFTHSANILTLGGNATAIGSWGSTTSPSTYKNDTYFAATTGIINVSATTCPVVAATISGTATICTGGSTDLSVAISGGVSPYTVVYSGSPSGGATLTSYVSGTNIPVSPTATTTYTITSVSDAFGCPVASPSGSAVVTINTTTAWSATAANTTWTDAANWTCGVPFSASDVTINAGTNQPTIASNVAINSLTIDSGAIVTVTSGFDLLVTDVVANTGTLNIQNTANLLQVNNVSNTGAGTTNVFRNSSALKRLDYTLWCSPVSGIQTLNNFSPLTNSTRYYEYVTATSAYAGISSSNTFDLAKGYLIRMPNNWPTWAQVWNGQFTGTPNNGTINFTMSTADNGYNAVGNPYPSALDMSAFITANTLPVADNITGTLWFWRKTNDALNPVSYSTCTTAGCTLNNGAVYPDDSVISAGQGFIVQTVSSTTLNYTNTMRSGSNVNEFFKETQKNRYWIELTNSDNVNFGQNLIAYLPNATLGYDTGLDGLFFGDTKTTLMTLSDDKEVVIQARPEFNAQDVVPLVFKTDLSGSFTINLSKTEGLFSNGQNIYLRDNTTNIKHNLTLGGYTFTTEAGSFTNRFELEYQDLLSVNPNTFNENQVVIYKQKQEFVINSGATIMKSVQVYDVRGRLLIDKNNINASETKFTTGTTNQVLLVKIISENNEVVTKKVIQ